MNQKLTELFAQYDFDGAIILLAGKSKLPESEFSKLTRLGYILGENSKHMHFRSGNADGADLLFSQGIAAVAKERLTIVTPYTGHRQKLQLTDQVVNLNDIDLKKEPEIIEATKANRKNASLVDRYLQGNRDKFSIKAAYLLRDTLMVLGTSSPDNLTLSKIAFAIFWDDLSKPASGGTGHTMLMCRNANIPIVDQSTWYSWLD